MEHFEPQFTQDMEGMNVYQEKLDSIENQYKIKGIWCHRTIVEEEIPAGQAILTSLVDNIHDIINRIQTNSKEFEIGKASNIHPLVDHAKEALGEAIMRSDINDHDPNEIHTHHPIV